MKGTAASWVAEPAEPHGRRKQRLLEGREVVEHACRRFHRHLGVREECAAGLFLKRTEPRIMLVAALPVGAIGVLAHDWGAWRARRPDRRDAVRSGDRDV